MAESTPAAEDYRWHGEVGQLDGLPEAMAAGTLLNLVRTRSGR